MTSTIRLGRLWGIEVGLHWSWLVIFGLLVWSLADQVFPETNAGLSDGTYVAMAIVATPLFFGSLLLHELGHARQAIREEMEIDGITLWIFGGVARFKGMFPSAGAEFRIAIAGPIVSLMIGISALAVALIFSLPDAVDGVVSWLGFINLVLLAFNMIPALPLDGGRVLRAALWAYGGDFLNATRRASALGRGFGQVLVGVGIVLFALGGGLGGLWLVFIGWFLIAAAEAERMGGETHAALSGICVRDAMVSDPVVADAAFSLDEFMSRCFFPNRHVAYPVLDGGSPTGIVSFRAAMEVPRDLWDQWQVRDVMTPLAELPQLAPRTLLEDAIGKLSESPVNRALVLERGHLAGLLSITDAVRITEAMRAEAIPQPAGARRRD